MAAEITKQRSPGELELENKLPQLSAMESAIHGEMDRISRALTRRVKQLAERYATPLPKLAAEVDLLAAHVDAHLKKKGFNGNVAGNNADKQRV